MSEWSGRPRLIEILEMEGWTKVSKAHVMYDCMPCEGGITMKERAFPRSDMEIMGSFLEHNPGLHPSEVYVTQHYDGQDRMVEGVRAIYVRRKRDGQS